MPFLKIKNIILFFTISILLSSKTYGAVEKRILIHGTSFNPLELPAGMTGFGDSFHTYFKKTLYSPRTLYSPGEYNDYSPFLGKAEDWRTYYKFEYINKFYKAVLLRSVMVDVAIDLYEQFLEQMCIEKETEVSLNLVGLSHGGTIALLLTNIIKCAQQSDLNLSLDDDIKKNKSRIMKIKKRFSNISIKEIKLTTIGTPVCYESNLIVQNNVKESSSLVTEHIHVFSEHDRTQTIDPGMASRYWGKLKSNFSLGEDLYKLGEEKLKQLKVSGVFTDKQLDHLDVVFQIIKNEEDIKKIQEFASKKESNKERLCDKAIVGCKNTTKPNMNNIFFQKINNSEFKYKFSNNFFRSKKVVSIGALFCISTAVIIRVWPKIVQFYRKLKTKKKEAV